MYGTRKYIIVDDCFPVLFHAGFKHDQVKTMGKVTSAGFFKIINGEVSTFGKSLGLNMEPGDFDAEIIQKFLFD